MKFARYKVQKHEALSVTATERVQLLFIGTFYSHIFTLQ